MSNPKRPALRWHGGKWRLAPWIISHFPAHKIYVEPFGGAASVLIRKPKSYAEIYNDLDTEVVNLFHVLRSPDAGRLIEILKLTPFSYDEFQSAYQLSNEPVERARRLIIRSFMGFGSNGHARKTGFRANSNRSGTTPAHDWVNYPDCLVAIVERFSGVTIENRDAVQIMRQHDGPDTLHYIDPPYVKSTRDSGDDYSFEMDDEDHQKLLSELLTIEGPIVLSGYPSDLYSEILNDWTEVKIAALADGAKSRTEVLWLNPLCAEKLAAAKVEKDKYDLLGALSHTSKISDGGN